MSPRSRLPQTRRHLMIYDEDWELIDQLFGPASAQPVGTGKFIKLLVHRKCAALRQKTTDKLDKEGLAQAAAQIDKTEDIIGEDG